MPRLSERERRFVTAYLTVCNLHGTKSAIAAGYSPISAATTASRMLKKPHILYAIKTFADRADITTDKALQRIAVIADQSPKKWTGADVLKANELILRVNGALKDHTHDNRVTVNIGFLLPSPDPVPQRQIIDASTPAERQIIDGVLPQSPQLAESDD